MLVMKAGGYNWLIAACHEGRSRPKRSVGRHDLSGGFISRINCRACASRELMLEGAVDCRLAPSGSKAPNQTSVGRTLCGAARNLRSSSDSDYAQCGRIKSPWCNVNLPTSSTHHRTRHHPCREYWALNPALQKRERHPRTSVGRFSETARLRSQGSRETFPRCRRELPLRHQIAAWGTSVRASGSQGPISSFAS